eukprot:TRINITY_DN47515_c0_g1_i1.p1 TRINITY_DN47515_c0_g1~~TRINITY_DN47515_c0_g1_i1.p1  ORF type:complete len:379 (-),score=46.81 TRINITY_DN47515_c0_g1_i1:177-1313(-)
MFRKMWKMFDLNGDGVVDEYEFLTVLRQMNPHWTETDAQRLLRAYDSDGDGKLDYQDFFYWLFDEGRWYKKESKSKPGCVYYVNADTKQTSLKWPPYSDSKSQGRAKAMLLNMDSNADGVVTPTEFIGALMALDTNGDKVLQRSEFPVCTYQKDLFDVIDDESSFKYIATGAAGAASKLNGAFHEAGFYNTKLMYKNRAGGVIRWECGADGDWCFQNVGIFGQPKWVALLDGNPHYFRDFRDSVAPQPGRHPPLTGWESVKVDATLPRRILPDGFQESHYKQTVDFELQEFAPIQSGDGLITVKEIADSFRSSSRQPSCAANKLRPPAPSHSSAGLPAIAMQVNPISSPATSSCSPNTSKSLAIGDAQRASPEEPTSS